MRRIKYTIQHGTRVATARNGIDLEMYVRQVLEASGIPIITAELGPEIPDEPEPKNEQANQIPKTEDRGRGLPDLW